MTSPAAGHPPNTPAPETTPQPAWHPGRPAQAALQAAGAAVLVPFNAGHQTRIPAGQRFALPRVAAHLLPVAARPVPSGRRPRRALLAIAVTVAVVLATTAFVAVRTTAGQGPRDAVTRFFAALTNHDLSLAVLTTCDHNPLCESDALTSGYQAPQDVTIGDETGSGDKREFPVTYTVAGQQHRTTIPVGSSPTNSTFQSRTWHIITPPGATLTLPDHTPAPISIAAAGLPEPKPDKVMTFWAPPGQYTVNRPATPLLEAAQTAITVTSGPAITITIPTALKAGVTDTANHLVHARLDECATKHNYLPTIADGPAGWNSCPFAYTDRHTSSSAPTWTITTYPQLHLEPTDDGWAAVTTTTPGTTTIRFQWTREVVEPRTWTEVTESIDVTVTGLIIAADGDLAWKPM